MALNDMRIKFPGKTDDEADYLLDKVTKIVTSWMYSISSILMSIAATKNMTPKCTSEKYARV